LSQYLFGWCKTNKGLRLIVSFADPDEGHIGAAYQAGNWIFTGSSSDYVKYLTPDGKLLHPRQVSKTGVKPFYGQLTSVPKFSDCEKVHSSGKYRYLMPLDDAMRKQVEPLRKPYPKRGTGETDNAAGSNLQTGGASPTVPLSELETQEDTR
jgi:hypothetical protein